MHGQKLSFVLDSGRTNKTTPLQAFRDLFWLWMGDDNSTRAGTSLTPLLLVLSRSLFRLHVCFTSISTTGKGTTYIRWPNSSFSQPLHSRPVIYILPCLTSSQCHRALIVLFVRRVSDLIISIEQNAWQLTVCKSCIRRSNTNSPGPLRLYIGY